MALTILCNERQISFRAWSLRLWRFSGAVFVDQTPVRRASLAVFWAITQCNFAAQEAFHVAVVQGLDPHRPCGTIPRRWRALLPVYIGPCFYLLGPTSGGVQRTLGSTSCLLPPSPVGYGFALISGVGNLAVFLCRLVLWWPIRLLSYDSKSFCDPVSPWAIQVATAAASSPRDLGASCRVQSISNTVSRGQANQDPLASWVLFCNHAIIISRPKRQLRSHSRLSPQVIPAHTLGRHCYWSSLVSDSFPAPAISRFCLPLRR